MFALLGLVALAGAGLWYARSLPQPVPLETGRRPMAGPTPQATPLFVHVAGLVRRPGVYELRPGDRVIDAVEAAGGIRRGADLDSLNLAASLVDGQQVLVARRGAPGTGPAAAAGMTAGKVNLNTADAALLDTLPGIGQVLAARIIEHRERHGPFRSVDDLVNVSGIGEVTLEDLRDLVTV